MEAAVHEINQPLNPTVQEFTHYNSATHTQVHYHKQIRPRPFIDFFITVDRVTSGTPNPNLTVSNKQEIFDLCL